MISFSCQTGRVFVEGEHLTAAKLNAAALPIVTLTGKVSAAQIEANAINSTHAVPDAYFFGEADYSDAVYSFSVNSAYTTHVTGTRLYFLAYEINTGSCSVSINSMDAVPLLSPTGSSLVKGDIVPNQIVPIAYDGSSYRLIGFYQINPISVSAVGFNGVAAIYITSSNLSNNLMTITDSSSAQDHTLETGDGVSFTGTMPSGLLADTKYWVCVVTATTFHVYTTRAAALAGGTDYIILGTSVTGCTMRYVVKTSNVAIQDVFQTGSYQYEVVYSNTFTVSPVVFVTGESVTSAIVSTDISSCVFTISGSCTVVSFLARHVL
jgi:hypothetical protein